MQGDRDDAPDGWVYVQVEGAQPMLCPASYLTLEAATSFTAQVIYDFTAAAVLKDWDIKLALLDILWGSFVFFISAYIGSLFGR